MTATALCSGAMSRDAQLLTACFFLFGSACAQRTRSSVEVELPSTSASPEAPTSAAAPPGSGALASLGLIDKARMDAARPQAEAESAAVQLWRATHDDSCPSHEVLVRDRMIDENKGPEDPWGTRLSITCADDAITVRSAGPDRKLGTSDDVVAETR